MPRESEQPFTSTCSVCWKTFVSDISQLDADAQRREHECPGSPWRPNE